MGCKFFCLSAFMLLASCYSNNALSQEQAHLSATAREIQLAFSDRFAQHSALHLARWYAYMGRPHPQQTDHDWQKHLQLAAKEAMQCVNAATPRYIQEMNLQSSLPSADARMAKNRLVNLIVQGLYGPGNDANTIRTFEQQLNAWEAPADVGSAEGKDEAACFQKRPLPHLQWLITHAAAPEIAKQDAQALLAYPDHSN